MFPWSSICQQFPGQNPSEVNDHNYDENPDSSNGQDRHDDFHDHYHHRDHHQVYSSFPAIFEDDGMLLSHLLYSQEQLIVAGNSTSTPHTNSQAHTDEISVVASNQAVRDHHHHIDPTSDENPSKLRFSKKQRAKVVQDIIPLRSTRKKDRHSKISTAQGLRDRRMRLSLKIARTFFDLQDMLGFDKASKTIEWLISKSKIAIKELKAKQSCSTSEGEVVSKTPKKLEDIDDDDDGRDESSIRMRKEKKKKKLHKIIARESRDKARARARERTREKILEKSRQSTATTTGTEDANNIDNTSTVDLGKLRVNSSLKMVASSFDQDQLPISDADQLLEYYSISRANSEDAFLGFRGNWEDNNIIDYSTQPESFCRSTVANTKSGTIENVRAQNPSSIFTTTLSSDTEERKPPSSAFFPVTTAASNAAQRQNPSSIFATTSSGTHFEENPSSVFMAARTTGRNYATDEQNPRPVFVTTSNIVHQEQNPSSNFFLGTTNIFCMLNF